MDRRQEKTRKAVFRAFTELLEEKSYAALTVQEIIDRADIGRSTFYSHFETKDDLLRAMCTEIFEHVFSSDLKKENTHDFSGEERDLPGEITHILYHLQDSRPYLKGILACESGQMFMQHLQGYLGQLFSRELEQVDTEVPKDYLLHHLVSDFTETVRWWLAHPSYSPEEICRFFLSSTPFSAA